MTVLFNQDDLKSPLDPQEVSWEKAAYSRLGNFYAKFIEACRILYWSGG
jgi:hypothetical protein